MIFKERKISTGYEYHNEDYYGTLNIESPHRLDGKILDTIVLQLMNRPSHSGDIGDITYTLTRKALWEEDEQ